MNIFNRDIDKVNTRLLWRVQRAENERDIAIKQQMRSSKQLAGVQTNFIALEAKYKEANKRAHTLQLQLNRLKKMLDKENT